MCCFPIFLNTVTMLFLLTIGCSQNASDYLAEVYGYAFRNDCLTIVMEFLPKGDLFGVLHTVRKARLTKLTKLRKLIFTLYLPSKEVAWHVT